MVLILTYYPHWQRYRYRVSVNLLGFLLVIIYQANSCTGLECYVCMHSELLEVGSDPGSGSGIDKGCDTPPSERYLQTIPQAPPSFKSSRNNPSNYIHFKSASDLHADFIQVSQPEPRRKLESKSNSNRTRDNFPNSKRWTPYCLTVTGTLHGTEILIRYATWLSSQSQGQGQSQRSPRDPGVDSNFCKSSGDLVAVFTLLNIDNPKQCFCRDNRCNNSRGGGGPTNFQQGRDGGSSNMCTLLVCLTLLLVSFIF